MAARVELRKQRRQELQMRYDAAQKQKEVILLSTLAFICYCAAEFPQLVCRAKDRFKRNIDYVELIAIIHESLPGKESGANYQSTKLQIPDAKNKCKLFKCRVKGLGT